MKKGTKIQHKKKKRRLSSINLICWIIIPIGIISMLILDGLGLYAFNTERIIVLGVGIVIVLLPFFSEITIKNFSIKKDSSSK